MNPEPFDHQAQFYADYRPVYPDEMYQFIFSHLKRRQFAWDCATGSGQIARYLSNHFEAVDANDTSSGQLRHAVQKKNITYTLCSVYETPYPEHHFDLITVGQAIHWFDFTGFYKEVKRVVRESALLAVIGYGRLQMDDDIDPILNKLYADAFESYFSTPRSYLDNEYRSIPFPFDEIPAPELTIPVRWTLDHLKGYVNSWSAIQRFKDEHGSSPADQALKELEAIVGGSSLEGQFPLYMRLGRVTS